MKKLNKQLKLNKKTVSKLNQKQMEQVQGGFTFNCHPSTQCPTATDIGISTFTINEVAICEAPRHTCDC